VIVSRKILDAAATVAHATAGDGDPTPRERMLVRMHGRQLAHAVAARGITSAIVHVSCGDDWIRSLASRLGITVTARGACYEITRPDDLT
jgi:hypothetical protein